MTERWVAAIVRNDVDVVKPAGNYFGAHFLATGEECGSALTLSETWWMRWKMSTRLGGSTRRAGLPLSS